MAEKKKAVSFTASDLSDAKSKKQPPTQKYDRKEIQKRLDIENWMDEELKRIYGIEVSCSYRTSPWVFRVVPLDSAFSALSICI